MWYQKSIAYLQKLEPYSSALVTILAAFSSIGISTALRNNNQVLVFVFAIIFVIFVVLQGALVRSKNRLGQGFIEREKTINEILEASAKTIKSIVGTEKHLRASIMLPSPNRQTRKVQYKYGFVDGDTDKQLELEVKLGNTGVAWRRRAPHYTDMQQAAKMMEQTDAGIIDYGLTAEQQRLVRPSLKSMLSVPIFDPDFPDHPLLGTLAFDSDNSLEEMRFKETDIH